MKRFLLSALFVLYIPNQIIAQSQTITVHGSVDSLENNFLTHIIDTSANEARSVYAADLNGDGDMDVVSGHENSVDWYQNDGSQSFSPHNITTNANSVQSVYAADVDGDGDTDVLSASFNDDKIAWYENNGTGSFVEHIITTGADGALCVYSVDLDDDGDMDVLSASRYDDKIAWYENDGSENFSEHDISNNADFARSVFAADIDADGDIDILSASENDDKIAWYENDGTENFAEHAITTNATGAHSVYAADIKNDNDGHMDVLSSSHGDDTIAWYENDGNENFTMHTISDSADFARSVYAADIDEDGDMEVLSASGYDDKIVWYENNGTGSFLEHIITTNADFAHSVYAEDIDGDGDKDVLSASFNDDKIAWYENLLNPIPPSYEGPLWYVSETIGNDSTGDGSAIYPFQTVRKALDEISALSLMGQDTIFISGRPPDGGVYYLSNPIDVYLTSWAQDSAYIKLSGFWAEYSYESFFLSFKDIVFDRSFLIEVDDGTIYLHIDECIFNNGVRFVGFQNLEGIVESSIISGEYRLAGDDNLLMTKNNRINGDLIVSKELYNEFVIEENEINGNVYIFPESGKRLLKPNKIVFKEIQLIKNRIRGNLEISSLGNQTIDIINNIIEGDLFLADATLSIINNTILGGLKIVPEDPPYMDLTIKNNIIYSQNGGIGIDALDCSLYYNFIVDWNNLYGFNTLVTCLDTTGHHLTSFNPYFADSLYHLFDMSPARDAGDPDLSYNDIDGTRNDLGVYGGPGGEIYNYPNRLPDWYVSETIGNDSTGDGSPAYPLQTIRKALDEISAFSLSQQDTILISGKPPDQGTYDLSNPISVHFVPWDQDTAYIELSFSAHSQGIFLYFKDIAFDHHIDIDGTADSTYLNVNKCVFKNGVGLGTLVGMVENSLINGDYGLFDAYFKYPLVTRRNIINGDLQVEMSHGVISIEENEINGNVWIYPEWKKKPLKHDPFVGEIILIKNKIRGWLQFAELSYDPQNIEVNNNIIEGNLFLADVGTLSVTNNTIRGGLRISPPVYPININMAIENNIIYSDSGDIGIDAPNCSLYLNPDFVVKWNNLYGFDTLVTCLDTTGLHLTSFNPYFADSLYHLFDISPARDAGDPDPSYNDIDGTRNDLGAYGGPGGESYPYPPAPPQEFVIGEVFCPSEVSQTCTVTVRINIDMNNVLPPDTLLGSFTATLEWNPTKLDFVSHSGILQGFVGVVNTTHADSGLLIFNGANPYGASGIVNVLNIHYNVIGSVGAIAPLNLEFSSMGSAYTFRDLLPILVVSDDSLTITEEFLGDVNCDGQSNSTDALIILSYDAGLPILDPCAIERLSEGFGDVNSDSNTNSLDALIIISYDVGIPVPFPVGDPVCLPNATSHSNKFNKEYLERNRKR